MTTGLVIQAGDLIGRPGKQLPFSGTTPVNLRLGETTVDGPMVVDGIAHGHSDAVKVEFEASARAHMVCTRCLTEWEAPIAVASVQYFGNAPDEDGYAIAHGEIDIAGPAKDELALALPPVPLCKPGCLGLCPTCGTDLNNEPCDGHGDDSDSPFAVLKDLFDS